MNAFRMLRVWRPALLLPTSNFVQSTKRADSRADQRGFVVGRQNLQREALQRTHPHHGFKVAAQKGNSRKPTLWPVK